MIKGRETAVQLMEANSPSKFISFDSAQKQKERRNIFHVKLHE